MINNILDFGQIRAGKFMKYSHNFDIRDAIYQVIEIEKQIAELRDIKLSANFEGFPQKN